MVAEAMWKARPVIATLVGGIPVQIQDGVNGSLTEDADGRAARIVELLGQPRLALDIQRAARATVRERFLMPRLLNDHLQLSDELLSAQRGATPGRLAAQTPVAGEASSARSSAL